MPGVVRKNAWGLTKTAVVLASLPWAKQIDCISVSGNRRENFRAISAQRLRVDVAPVADGLPASARDSS